MAERYNFKYLPLVGKLPGKSMVEQTETAINELASVVYDNVGHVGNLAEEVQTANANASNALDKATEALETSSRVYIKQIAAVDVNDYYDSELYYIDNDGSTNIPVRDRGFLEVKTNDDKTACEQVFIADSTGTPYYRHGRITEQTLGEETTYVVTWGSWYQGATTEYVQAELQDYLPLSGGTLTGVVNGVTPTAGDNSTKIATTEFVNAKAGNYLPLSGGTLTGRLTVLNGQQIKFAQANGTAGSGGWIGSTATGLRITSESWNLADAPGVRIEMNGKNYATNPSQLDIVLTDSTQSKTLTLRPDGTLTWNSQPLLPVGIVQAFAGTTIPSGWLLCDGSAVSRTTYANLYAVIGTTYGAGDGSTTFNLPNLVDKFVEGSATAGTVKSAGLPNITGELGFTITNMHPTGAFGFTTGKTCPVVSGNNGDYNAKIDASRSSSIYGNSNTVQPPSVTMRYIIKY